MSVRRVLIIDGDERQRKKLNKLISDTQKNVVIYEASNAKDAFVCAMDNTIDVFILDIVLNKKKRGDLSGIDFLKYIRNYNKYFFTPIIIVSGVEDPGNCILHTFHCFDYIEYPYDSKMVTGIISEALRYKTCEAEECTLYIKQNRITYPIRCEDIVYINAENRKKKIHMIDGRQYDILYYSMEDLLKKADYYKLIQCSRDSVVNLEYIKSIDYVSKYIVLTTNDILDIGVTYIKKIKMLISGK